MMHAREDRKMENEGEWKMIKLHEKPVVSLCYMCACLFSIAGKL